MRVAIISDVHGNVEALQSVLYELEHERIDQCFCLGDLVGYGPNPNECCELLREKARLIIAGNHDYAAVGMTDANEFNRLARDAVLWTGNVLSRENREYLRALPLSASQDNFLLVHASPSDPPAWRYILSREEACRELHAFAERICFIGHSHQPLIYIEDNGHCFPSDIGHVTISPHRRYIINVGSVGQPRDGDPRACVCIYDGTRLELFFKRYPYNVAETQRKIHRLGLPRELADRLAYGW